EAGPRLRRLLEPEEAVVQAEEHRLENGHLEKKRRQRELQGRARDDGAPGKGAAILGDEPGDQDEREEAKRALSDQRHAQSRNALPFKGRVRVGMGLDGDDPTPILSFPLRGKEFLFDLMRVVYARRQVVPPAASSKIIPASSNSLRMRSDSG